MGTHRLTSVCYTVCSTRCSPHTRLHTKEAAFSLNPSPQLPSRPSVPHHPSPTTARVSSHSPASTLASQGRLHTHSPRPSHPSAQTTVPSFPLPVSPIRPLTLLLGTLSSHQGALLPPAPHHSIFPDPPRTGQHPSYPPVLRQLQTSICEPAFILRGLGSWKGRTGAAAQGFRYMIVTRDRSVSERAVLCLKEELGSLAEAAAKGLPGGRERSVP